MSPLPHRVATSADDCDPDIAPAGAIHQVAMVSDTTGSSHAALRRLITEEPQGVEPGLLGSTRTDVLQPIAALAAVR